MCAVGKVGARTCIDSHAAGEAVRHGSHRNASNEDGEHENTVLALPENGPNAHLHRLGCTRHHSFTKYHTLHM